MSIILRQKEKEKYQWLVDEMIFERKPINTILWWGSVGHRNNKIRFNEFSRVSHHQTFIRHWLTCTLIHFKTVVVTGPDNLLVETMSMDKIIVSFSML